MKRFTAAIAAFFVCAALLPVHSDAARAAAAPVLCTGTCLLAETDDAPGCGKERVHIKQLVDADVSKIRTTPVDTTVAALRALPVPKGFSPRNDTSRYAPELQIYRLRALWLGWKKETDRDFHLVIADTTDASKTMIAESVDPTCTLAASSKYAAAFRSVRAAFAQCGLVPKAAYKKFAHPVTVEIEGPAFFDIPHGQTGHAPNAIEIHPLLAISSLECPK